jgi:hypothetical protein
MELQPVSYDNQQVYALALYLRQAIQRIRSGVEAVDPIESESTPIYTAPLQLFGAAGERIGSV